MRRLSRGAALRKIVVFLWLAVFPSVVVPFLPRLVIKWFFKTDTFAPGWPCARALGSKKDKFCRLGLLPQVWWTILLPLRLPLPLRRCTIQMQ